MGDGLNFVQTRCSALKNTAVQYQEVVYANPAKKTKQDVRSELALSAGDKDVHNDQEIDIKRARYEIVKFAKTSGKTINKQQTNRELAMKLGAIPPRHKKCVNYKIILARKQKKKIKKERKVDLKKINEKYSDKLLNNKRKNKPKRKKSGVLDIYGKLKEDVGKR